MAVAPEWKLALFCRWAGDCQKNIFHGQKKNTFLLWNLR